VRGVRPQVADFTSFSFYSFTRGIPHALRARAWPRITRYDDRWRWLITSVVPRFRRFDADTPLVDASLRRIFDAARDFASSPCVPRVHPRTGHGELRNPGDGAGHGPTGEQPAQRPAAPVAGPGPPPGAGRAGTGSLTGSTGHRDPS
jgi:hypothetical protein